MSAPATARLLPDALPPLGGTRRPRLLIAAARHGMEDYRRTRDLPRLIGPGIAAAEVIDRLAALEERLEDSRRTGDPGWSCLRHVEVLIALLAERALHAE
ncbi:MAG: DUF6477 family protein [Rhodobacteraceae bacterium]|nr:DUF6477 family protein [Paracoccaceae bacterium]